MTVCFSNTTFCQDYSDPEIKKYLERKVIEKKVKEFFLGILKSDKELINNSIIPNANAKVLWSGHELPAYIRQSARKIVGYLTVLHLEPGDLMDFGAGSIEISSDHVNNHQRLLVIELAGMNTLLYVRKYRGQWRLDANMFVEMYVDQNSN